MTKFVPCKSIVLGVVVLAGSIPAAMAAAPDLSAATPSQETARVWFLRPSSSANAAVWGSGPMVYVNGAPLAAIPADSAFYRDVPAGRYSFSVEPYGLPTGAADTVQLTPGSQTYLEVQWVPTWEEGYPGGGRGDQSHSFFV